MGPVLGRSRAVLWLSVLLLAALAEASVAPARSTSYAVAPTKSCLGKRGATFQKGTPGVVHAGLTAAQQAETMIGTLPEGGAPAFFFVVVGRTPADAAAVLKVLRPGFPLGSRWSGSKENATWTLVSITGPATPAVKSTLLSCLRVGAAPTGTAPSPPTYTASAVGACMAALSNGAVMHPAEIRKYAPLVFGGRNVPASVLPHTLLVYTATDASRRDGLGIFIVFGKDGAEAARLRGSLEHALAVPGAGTTRGTKKNVAWTAFKLRQTTIAGAAAGTKVLATCLN